MSRVKAVMTGSTRAMPMGANDGHRPTCTAPMYPTARAPDRGAPPGRKAAQPCRRTPVLPRWSRDRPQGLPPQKRRAQVTEGRKDDRGKPRWSLLPQGTVMEIVKVLEYGAQKYGDHNWMLVPDASRRYYDAAMRHLEAWRNGEDEDPESGLPHLAHAACSLLFLQWFEMADKEPEA